MTQDPVGLAIELNDAGLRAVSELRGLLPLISPGYALVRGSSIVTGEPAEQLLRHEPRSVHHRFWQGLDHQPLDRPFPSDLSTADLAHAHLESYWDEVTQLLGTVSPLLVTVPGSMDRHQLGLLVGIARAAEIPLAGLVDAAVAAAVDTAPTQEVMPERLLHVGLGLHRTVLTELRAPEGLAGSVERGRVSLVEIGRHEMAEAWSRHIGSRFVRATRFDPLHHAASEEQLFGSLEDWVEATIEDGQTVAELEAGRRHHRVELDLSDFTEPLRGAIERISRGVAELATPESLVLLDPALGRLPSLGERIELEVGCRWRRLAPGASARGALLRANQLEGPTDSVVLVTSLRLAEAGARESRSEASSALAFDPADEAAPEDSTPSHLLFRGVALELGCEPFVIGSGLRDGERGLALDPGSGLAPRHCVVLKRAGEVLCIPEEGETVLAGRRLEKATPLRAGDRLRLGDTADVEVIRIAKGWSSRKSP